MLQTFLPNNLPSEHRQNFYHLVFDIVGFGILNGSAVAFVSVYATRLGATNWQLGILSALPALVTLGLALPAGGWIRNRPITTTTRWAAIIFRHGYILWAFLPLLGTPTQQINWLLVTVLLMGIPGTILAISFNALYAAAVPIEWRGQVMTWRQTSYAISSILISLISGLLLDRIPFPYGYQLIFLIGYCGGLWSSWHLWQVRLNPVQTTPNLTPVNSWAQMGQSRGDQGVRVAISLRTFLQYGWRKLLQTDVLRSDFKYVLLLLFAMHFSQYFSIPLHPLRYVKELGLSDTVIGIGNALFYAGLFVTATQYAQIEGRLGDRNALGVAIFLMGFFPLCLALAQGAPLYLIANIFGGSGVAILMGSTGNFLLSVIPEDNRPTYLAWYNLFLNAAVLTGSLAGPAFAQATSLTTALFLAFFLRGGSAWLLWRSPSVGSRLTFSPYIRK